MVTQGKGTRSDVGDGTDAADRNSSNFFSFEASDTATNRGLYQSKPGATTFRSDPVRGEFLA